MKKLVITLPKYKFADYVLVNGKNVEFKRNKQAKCFYAEYMSETDQVNISFDTFNPLTKWSWWLLGVLFFLITVFGIFDSHESHKFIYRYQAIVTLHDGDNFVNMIPQRGKEKVVKVETDCGYDELINAKDRDKVIKRRSILLILTKVFIILGAIAVAAVLLLLAVIALFNKATTTP